MLIEILIYEKHVDGTAFWRGFTEEEREDLLSLFSAAHPDLTVRDGVAATYKAGWRLGDGVHIPVRIDE